ncbi:MAG: metallophosphoesterase [Anaerorhabdus sp.]|uniref:metallophosphoesterase n=1 Tax=Anaerorhabdus sp. TaxID=1872524 RepID=UPI002FC80811
MKKFYLILLSAMLLSGCTSEKPVVEKPETIRFYVTSDTHLYNPEIVENKELFDDLALNQGDGRLLNYAPEIFNAFIDEVIKTKPEFVLFTGDISLEGEKTSHQWIAKQLSRLIDNGIQPLVIPGNHDIMNPSSRTYGNPSSYINTVSAEEFASIYSDCGYSNALYRDENSLSYVYELRDNAWILMLDTARYEENTVLGSEGTGSIRSETYDWIEEIAEIAKEKNVQLISSTHHNIIKQNEYFSSDNTLLNTLKALRIFDERDIRVNFSGHIHAQNINTKEKENGAITDICSSSLLVYPSQYGIVDYVPFKELNYSTKAIDISTWASQNNNDPNLLDFPEYSYNYFKQSSTSRGASRFKSSSHTAEEIAQLLDAKGTLNCYYFAGRILEIKDSFMASDFYSWLIEQDETTSGYILSMLKTNGLDPNKITIDMSK